MSPTILLFIQIYGILIYGTLISKYTYDSLDQLHEEYDYLRGRYINYTYDNGGNIKLALESYLNSSGTIGGVCGSKNYTYGDSVWKDKLTKYGSYNITYDEIGNPINYRNGMTFSWKNGRWLASTTLSDNTTVTYQYNASGMRTKKTIGSTATNYYYDSNNNLIGLKSGADVAFFYYDADNSPVSMKYNNNMYYYVKNLQGDIVKILDSNGSAVAGYYYDAWGTITRKTVTNTTIDTLSPFRYRGYVYDIDTGLYYLQSRYYDPQTGRFINEDIYADTVSGSPLSTNTFAYCENNAINYSDKYGLYSRKNALFYLANYWNKRNTKFYSYSQDCANFVSQCLYAGGIKMNNDWHSYKLGLKEEYRILLLLGSSLVAFLYLIDDCHIYNWDITENWRLAKKQYNYFKNKNNGYTNEDVVKINSKGDIKTALKKYNIQPGDLLYFAGEEGNNIHHATIITGVKKNKKKNKYDIYYGAHSTSCCARSLRNNIDKEKVRIIMLK